MGLDTIYAEKQIANEPALEKKSELLSSKERVAAASKLFEENFDDNGRPITKRGQMLCRYYGDSYWEDYHYTVNSLVKWIKKARKATREYFKSEKQKELEVQLEYALKEISKLRSRVVALEMDLHNEE